MKEYSKRKYIYTKKELMDYLISISKCTKDKYNDLEQAVDLLLKWQEKDETCDRFKNCFSIFRYYKFPAKPCC